MLHAPGLVVLWSFMGLSFLVTCASAECAWVLWQETRSDMLAPGRPQDPVMFYRGTSLWTIWQAWPSQEACEATKERGRKYAQRDAGPIMKNGKAVGERVVDLQCLPDTVDPRGPKGR